MPALALRALFDADVAVEVLTDFSQAEPLREAESKRLSRAVPRRLEEFAAGRTCARRALARLGCAADADLAPLPDRRVDWPHGFTGTITHATGLAAAAVGRSEAYAGLGLDAELRDRVEPRLYRMIAGPEEIAWLEHAEEGQALRAATLFSAKEAFYKAQYPSSESYLGFKEVRFTERGDGFEIELLRDVPSLGERGMCFAGRTAVLPEHVLTTVCLRR